MNATTYEKSISYDRETRDYKMVLDGQLIGWARTYHEAEATLDRLAYEWLRRDQAAAADAAAERAEEAMSTIIIDEAGLNYCFIAVTADSAVDLTQHDVGRSSYYALLVDGVYYDLIQTKHVMSNDAHQATLERAQATVQAAIVALSPHVDDDADQAPVVDPALAAVLGEWGVVVTPVQMNGRWVQWVRVSDTDDVPDAPLPFDPAYDTSYEPEIPSYTRIDLAALDAACAVLADRHANDKRYLTALDRGRDYLREEGVINLTETGALIWYGLDGHGDYTPTSQVCQCEAYVRHSVICRHRVAAALVEEMDRASAQVVVASALARRDAERQRHVAFCAPVVAEVARVRHERAEAARLALLECWA